MIYSEQYAAMLKLVKHYHGKQTRSGGRVPYWHHCDRVAKLLAKILNDTKEGTLRERQRGVLAGLGHDLYEDTSITRDEIVAKFGPAVDQLIEELTNRQGDNDLSQYLKKLKTDSEMGRLIKLADMVDNYIDGSYHIHILGKKWSKSFLQPILEKQWRVLKTSRFRDYHQTSEQLKFMVAIGRTHLAESIER